MSILNYFFATSVQDVVAVYDQNFNQVFSKARIIKPVVKPTAKGMEHPLESGTTVTDHVILQPTELELTMIIAGTDISNTYETIYNYWYNKTLFTVQTKATDYSNMYILEMPHEESPDQYDAISIILNFKQALIATSTTSKTVPADPTNSNTVNRGTQIPGNVSTGGVQTTNFIEAAQAAAGL